MRCGGGYTSFTQLAAAAAAVEEAFDNFQSNPTYFDVLDGAEITHMKVSWWQTYWMGDDDTMVVGVVVKAACSRTKIHTKF